MKRSTIAETIELEAEKYGYKINSLLKKTYLKETPEMLAYKLGVINSEIELTIVGIISQSLNETEKIKLNENEELSFREAYNNVVNGMNAVDETLKSKSLNEIIIDPIAVYYEI